MKRSRFLLVLAVALVFVPTACSPGEELAEQIIESQEGVGDVDVDVDADSGEVVIESEDGSATIGGGEIPDDFPVDVPGGGEVLGVFESGTDATVTLTYDGDDIDGIIGFFEDWVADSGLEVVNKAEFSNPRSVAWTLLTAEGGYTISVAAGGGDDVAVTILVSGG